MIIYNQSLIKLIPSVYFIFTTSAVHFTTVSSLLHYSLRISLRRTAWGSSLSSSQSKSVRDTDWPMAVREGWAGLCVNGGPTATHTDMLGW